MNSNYLRVRLLFVLLFASLFYAGSIKAQQCGTDELQQRMWQQHPELLQQEQVNTLNWANYMQRLNSSLIINTSSGPEYEIPLVIHVMHTGGAIGSTYNPADSTLDSLVSYVNQVYAAKWSAYPDTNNGGVRLPIRFVLAKRDPLCDTSTGIVRYDASGLAGYTAYGVKDAGTNGPTDSTVKSLSIWSPYDYVNVWIVDKIDGNDGTSGTFIAGFAYIPPAPRYLDGVIMLATQAHSGTITLPHELGHVLGLYHTFQGGNTTTCPPSTNNCNVDNDQVCDTQPEMQSNFNCPSGTNPCSAVGYNNVQHNFMDYSNCQNRFTAGQETRMLYKLLNLRPGLLSSLGTTYPNGISVATASCTPGIVNASNTGDIGPTLVVLNDLQANSGGYNDDGNVAYRDETCLQRANLQTGQSYTLSVTIGPVNNENTKVWIDYNNDGVFQTSELVLNTTNTTAGGVATATVTIPSTATTCTPLRMRVMSDFASSIAPSSCTNVQYGQTEDYAVYITNPSSASISLTSGTNPGCLGASRTFTASSVNLGTAPVYNWYVNNVLVSSNATTYTTSTLNNGDSVRVLAYATTTGCRAADTLYSPAIYMTLNASVAMPTVGSNSPICAGSTLNLTASTIAGATYSWTGPNSYTNATQNPSSIIATTAGTGYYYVVASSGGCSSNKDSVLVTVNAVPAAPTASVNTPVCVGSAINLTATTVAGATYNWSGPNSYSSTSQNPTIASAALTNAGSYTVKATVAGCTSAASNTANLVVNTIPSAPTAGVNTPVCAGSAINLTATTVTGATYIWSGPNSYSSSTQNPTIASAVAANAGGYSVKVTVGGCTSAASNTASVVVDPAPAAPTAGSNSPVCAGSALNLTATTVTGATYGWTGPNSYTSTSQNPTIASAAASNAGTYSVKATAGGCSSAASTVTVVVNPTVTPTVAISPAPVGIGHSQNYKTTVTNGGTATTYQWTRNGANIAGATLDSINNIILALGDTLCVVIHSNAACASPATVKACTYGTVGVANVTSTISDLQLYPNPNDGSFTVYGTVPDTKTVNLEVVNIIGQIVHKEDVEISNGQLNRQIDINDMPPGIYLLKVSASSGVATIKFNVQL